MPLACIVYYGSKHLVSRAAPKHHLGTSFASQHGVQVLGTGQTKTQPKQQANVVDRKLSVDSKAGPQRTRGSLSFLPCVNYLCTTRSMLSAGGVAQVQALGRACRAPCMLRCPPLHHGVWGQGCRGESNVSPSPLLKPFACNFLTKWLHVF